MTSLSATVRLRYRPGSDVLSGEVDLGPSAGTPPVTESPDADTHIEWRPCLVADGTVLSSFQIVHISSLLDRDALRRLPPEVVTLARQLVRSGRGALREGATALERVQARAEAEATLTVADLLRPAGTPLVSGDDVPGDTRLAGDITAAVHRLATLIAALPHHDDLGRRDHLVHLLRELAEVMDARPGSASPGTSAAARAALRGGIPLTSSERRRLRWALTALDHPSTWESGLTAVVALTEHLAPGVDH